MILGPMFSGKTTYLLSQISKLGRQNSKVFKPVIDDRYSQGDLVSHQQEKVPALNVSSGEEIFEHLDRLDKYIFIDEIQFFDHSIVQVCKKLRSSGFYVRLAGLHKDSDQQNFTTSEKIRAIADKTHFLEGECAVCGASGEHTYCTSSHKNEQVVVGGAEMYECRCDNCI